MNLNTQKVITNHFLLVISHIPSGTKACMWKHTERRIMLLDSQFFPHAILEHTHGFYFGVLSRVVSSPDTPITCARPAALSRNRVWTLSLRELGQVYIQWSVNCIIVGVNYTICYQKHLLGAKKNCKLAICRSP